MSASHGWLGLDIGGANLKAANTDGYASQMEFPLWKHPERLASAIGELLSVAPEPHQLAVTMTGELADCFPTKGAGVSAIVDAVERAAGAKPTQYYSLRLGSFVGPEEAKRDWLGAAASNWHALAAACGRALGSSGLLIDVGSTTTDIVPFNENGAATQSITDTDRLLAGELLYQGVGRTPVCAIVRTLPVRGGDCPVAAELFATTLDAALLCDLVDESKSCGTADGRPAERAYAAARLARMICSDAADLEPEVIRAMATHVIASLERVLSDCLHRSLQAPRQTPRIIVSGVGEWLARSAAESVAPDVEVQSLGMLIGKDASEAAPAWAVAYLAEQQGRG